MASTIDTSKPVTNSALDSSVIRANFTAAYNDIGTLQTSVAALGTTSDVTFRDVTLRHIKRGSQTAPTSVEGTGAGTAPTVSISGTDSAFQYNLTTGGSTATSATITTFTFNVAYASAPLVFMVPSSRTAWEAQSTAATSALVGAVSTTGFVFNIGTTALTSTTAYSWRFLVIG